MASYRFEVALVPGLSFAIVAESVDELLTEYEYVKGNRDWLVEQLQAAVPATEAGEGVGALQAVLSDALSEQTATEQDVAPDEAEKPVERVDPWSGEKVQETPRRRSAARTEPSRATSAAVSQAPDESGVKPLIDRFGGRWLVGLPEAPDCECGEPAALHKWTTQKGKKATAYKCAKAAPEGDWRNKCEFFQYPD